MKNDWRPEVGDTYYIFSEYARSPYPFEWHNTPADKARYEQKVFYRTKEEAEAAGGRR